MIVRQCRGQLNVGLDPSSTQKKPEREVVNGNKIFENDNKGLKIYDDSDIEA